MDKEAKTDIKYALMLGGLVFLLSIVSNDEFIEIVLNWIFTR